MKHENYEILNLIGYGLSKFNNDFIRTFEFKSKINLFRYFVQIGIAETTGVVKNRQDLFDHFFDNGRRGWWQKGDTYIHRKHLIDNLFGDLNCEEYSKIVKLYIQGIKPDIKYKEEFQPIIKSKFRSLQETGLEAELYFVNNYNSISIFNSGVISDARFLGDGYDFQIEVNPIFYLIEVKGVREKAGGTRMTSNEYLKAQEFKDKFVLVIVSNLVDSPRLTLVRNPINTLLFESREITTTQTYYHTKSISW